MSLKNIEEGQRKHNVIIIGCGNQGAFGDAPGTGNENKYVSFAHAFKDNDGFNLVGFVDRNENKAMDAAVLYRTCWYTDLRNAFLGERDIAVVSTSDNAHYEILKELVNYPLKLVICEKPICETVEQAREIIELYKEKNIGLMVNYTRRFLPYYDKLKKYGKPTFGSCIFNRGWLHTATHAIEFFNMLGLDDYVITESHIDEYRVWDIVVKYQNYVFREERIGDMPVWDYYDNAMMHLVENAYNFLEGKEELKCTGEHALKALEKCYELMENKY